LGADVGRRELITLLGGAATVWPFVTFAQPAVPIIGFLSSRSPADTTTLVAAFRKGLGEAAKHRRRIPLGRRTI
jgi:putative tryptophan/tyrosine transport system substrate-binding protein